MKQTEIEKQMTEKLQSVFTPDQVHFIRDACTQLIAEIVSAHPVEYYPVLKDSKYRLEKVKESRRITKEGLAKSLRSLGIKTAA